MKENKDVALGWIKKAESDIENLTTMIKIGKALARVYGKLSLQIPLSQS